MTGTYRLTRDAQADIDQAAKWYGDRSPSAAEGFLRAATDTFERAAANPNHAPEIVRGARRRNLNRYPFSAWYVKRDYGILVFALWHHRLPQDIALARRLTL